MRHLLVIPAALCLLLASVVYGSEDQKDATKIEGTWLIESAELAGQKLPEDAVKVIKLVIKGDKYTVTVGEAADHGKTKLDPAKKPKTIDITGTEGPNKDKTILAIYELTKDSLKVCYDLSGKERRTEFKTKPATQLFLVTYKREKP